MRALMTLKRPHDLRSDLALSSEPTPCRRDQSEVGYSAFIDAKSGRHLAFVLTVNDVGVISGIDDVLPVFQDEGTISAILWKLH